MHSTFKDYSLEVLASTLEKYIGFQLKKNGCPIQLNFIDILQHLPTSLEKLVSNLQNEQFNILRKTFKNVDISLLTRKRVQPYDFIIDFLKKIVKQSCHGCQHSKID